MQPTTSSFKPIVSSALSIDQISTTQGILEEHPKIPNKLPIEKQNEEKDLSNERMLENEERNRQPEEVLTTFTIPTLPPIDSRVLLKSRIVPEAPIQNELFAVTEDGLDRRQEGQEVLKEKQNIPIKTTVERRIEQQQQTTSIPILLLQTAENNKNGKKGRETAQNNYLDLILSTFFILTHNFSLS